MISCRKKPFGTKALESRWLEWVFVDLYACRYEAADSNGDNLLGILMTTTLMIVEVMVISFTLFNDGD